jgi:hypothetical protein
MLQFTTKFKAADFLGLFLENWIWYHPIFSQSPKTLLEIDISRTSIKVQPQKKLSVTERKAQAPFDPEGIPDFHEKTVRMTRIYQLIRNLGVA